MGGGGGDAVKWNILVLSVVCRMRTCSIGPHLPAPFWCGRVFGQREEGGDHLYGGFLSETRELLNRILSAGASFDIQYSPPGHCAFFFQTDGRTDPVVPLAPLVA